MEDKRCKNHPEVQAKWECEMCKGLFCDECIKVNKVSNVDFQICKACGGKCDPLVKDEPPKDSTTAASSFFEQLPSVFSYPFIQGGALRFFIGILFFSFLNFIASYSIFGMFLAFFIAGYIFAWFIGIIHSTVNGEDTLASWPEFRDFWGDIVHPYFLIIGATFFCRLPALVCYLGFLMFQGGSIFSIIFFVQAMLSPFAIGYAFLPWYGAASVILLEILGAIYFPMAVLCVAMYGTLAALNPRIVLSSIAKVPGPYAIVCLLFFVMTITTLVGKFALALIPFIGPFLGYAMTFYLMVIQARTLGLVYKTSQKQLAWFEFEQIQNN